MQHRPHGSDAGRDAFVTFTREARPVHETTHEIAALVKTAEGDGPAEEGDGIESNDIAVLGCVVGENEQVLVDLIDVVTVGNDRIVELRTDTRWMRASSPSRIARSVELSAEHLRRRQDRVPGRPERGGVGEVQILDVLEGHPCV